MKEKIIRNLDELNKALEEGYTNFYTKRLIKHSYHITFSEEEDTYEVTDLVNDLIINMDKEEVIEWFEENFNIGSLIAND